MFLVVLHCTVLYCVVLVVLLVVTLAHPPRYSYLDGGWVFGWLNAPASVMVTESKAGLGVMVHIPLWGGAVRGMARCAAYP